MDSLKFSVFDLFSYALPGGIALLGFLLLKGDVQGIDSLTTELSKINASFGIVLIFLSYIIGNVLDHFGTALHTKLGFRRWGNPSETTSNVFSNRQKRILIREFSEQNNFFVQQWKVVKTMSHNLAFSFLLVAVTTLFKGLFLGVEEILSFLVIFLISIVFCYVFLRRAHIFDTWHYQDLDAVVDTLSLNERIGKTEKK